jgi:hypothetical protein
MCYSCSFEALGNITNVLQCLKFLHVLLHYTGEDPAGFR